MDGGDANEDGENEPHDDGAVADEVLWGGVNVGQVFIVNTAPRRLVLSGVGGARGPNRGGLRTGNGSVVYMFGATKM